MFCLCVEVNKTLIFAHTHYETETTCIRFFDCPTCKLQR